MEKITKKERLMIAATIMCGLQSPSYLPSPNVIAATADAALQSADSLMKLAGFEVEQPATIDAFHDMD